MCLFSYKPKIVISCCTSLQMLCRGQNCKFCQVEPRGKNDVKNWIKLQSTSFLLQNGTQVDPLFIAACMKFRPNWPYGFWEIDVEKFFVFYCFCQYIDKVNEESWQNMFIKINFCQFFFFFLYTNILWINAHITSLLLSYEILVWNIISYHRSMCSHGLKH